MSTTPHLYSTTGLYDVYSLEPSTESRDSSRELLFLYKQSFMLMISSMILRSQAVIIQETSSDASPGHVTITQRVNITLDTPFGFHYSALRHPGEERSGNYVASRVHGALNNHHRRCTDPVVYGHSIV